MDGKYNEVELLFIREVLDQHGEYLVDLLQDDIMRKRLRISDELMESLDYRVTNYGIDPVLLVSFFSYGRAIEIAYHKNRKNRAMLQSRTNRDIWGTTGRTRRKKNTRWYSRNVYGSINRLMSVLATEFSEEEKQRLKGIIDRQKATIQL